VKFSIQESAERDILRQVEWYAEPGLPDVARRFRLATKSSVAELLSTPQSGTPKLVANVQLKGLRTWSVRGFDGFRIYYLVQDDLIKVIRVLHGKRDIASILERETVDQAREKDRL
jgi:plasmid stabilization system protein ParE